jgi:predicted glycosyltransferase
VRDILHAPAKPERVDDTHRLLAQYYDGVLVHGDPNLIPLERSWPRAGEIADLLHYTGFIDAGARPSQTGRQGAGGILVSGGSSAAGLPLYRAALEAARLDTDRRWTILVGSGVGLADRERLAALAPDNATIAPARPEFRDLLRASTVFVGQAGYNTVVDLLATATPAVLVPFEAGGETEQSLRATILARPGSGRFCPSAPCRAQSCSRRSRRFPGANPSRLSPST